MSLSFEVVEQASGDERGGFVRPAVLIFHMGFVDTSSLATTSVPEGLPVLRRRCQRTGCSLTNNLIGPVADLSGANLAVANLEAANLTDADLDGVDLTRLVWSNTTRPDGVNSNNDGETVLTTSIRVFTWIASCGSCGY